MHAEGEDCVMEGLLKAALKTGALSRMGRGGGGCINEGEGYATDHGQVFVKRNSKPEARKMFDGEFEGLKAISETQTVTVPKPIVVLDNPKGGAVIVMDYIEMSPLRRHSAKLGEQFARLHLHNLQKLDAGEEEEEAVVRKFGFHTTTCCGFLPLDNQWCDDWVTFYTEQRLQHQINLLENKEGVDRELKELWTQLKPKIPEFFEGIRVVRPSLCHGDLWGGNAAETPDGPVIFDPATFYGHSEFDLSIAKMFGGFGEGFFRAYHQLLPRESGFDTRQQLYQLFHYLNHWNHFGSGYRGSTISTMRRLVAK